MLWEELSWPEHKKMVQAGAVVVVPFASMEQHGPHNPVVVDTLLCESVCQKAVDGLENVLLTPTMWAGASCHHIEYPGTISLRLETYVALIKDIIRSVAHHGYKKIFTVNGHGGNAQPLQATLNDIGYDLDITIWMVTYFHLGNEIAQTVRKSEVGGMGHSGEFETAMMLHLRPDLVNMDDAVDQPNANTHPLMTKDMHRRGMLFHPVDFNRNRAPSGVSGTPTAATAENGGKYFESVSARLHSLIEDMAALKT